ncbi:MAG TPA: hypothetical protein VIJ23_13285 [Mycobacterium sp.]
MRRSTRFGADVDAGDRTGYFAQFDAFGIARSFATLSTGVAFAIAKWLAAKEGLCWEFTPS